MAGISHLARGLAAQLGDTSQDLIFRLFFKPTLKATNSRVPTVLAENRVSLKKCF